jgi:hypothetical protein
MKSLLFRFLAIAFGLLSFGGISEMHRIITSNAPDIAAARGYLTVVGIIMLGLSLFLTRYFWIKAKQHK